MKKRKGFMRIIWIAVIVVAAMLGAFAFVPDISASIQSMIGEKQPCRVAPYDPNCFCADDEDRLNFMAFGNPKFVCEPKAKFIDPASADWRQESIDYAMLKLDELYPSCTMKSCEGGTWRVDAGVEEYENRIISVECWVSDQRFAEVEFYLVDGIVTDSNCGDYFAPQPGEPTFVITYKGEGPGYDMIRLFWDANCEMGTGTATGSYKYVLGENKVDALDWWFHGTNRPQTISLGAGAATCNIDEKTARSMTLDCSAQCTGYGGYGGDMAIRWQSDDSQYCQYDIITPYYTEHKRAGPTTQICDTTEGKLYVCQGPTWAYVSDGCTASQTQKIQ